MVSSGSCCIRIIDVHVLGASSGCFWSISGVAGPLAARNLVVVALLDVFLGLWSAGALGPAGGTFSSGSGSDPPAVSACGPGVAITGSAGVGGRKVSYWQSVLM